jgi:hypothetical protein
MQVTVDDEVMDEAVVEHLTVLYKCILKSNASILSESSDLSKTQKEDLDDGLEIAVHISKVIEYLLSPSDYNNWFKNNFKEK